MDRQRNKEEMYLYENVERSLRPYKRRKRVWVWLVRLAKVIVFALLVVYLGRCGVFGNKFADFLKGFSKNNAPVVSGEDETESATDKGGEDETRSADETDSAYGTSEETESVTAEKDTEEGSEEDTVEGSLPAEDLSFAERGDGYIINRTDWSPDTDALLDKGFSGSQPYYSELPVVMIIHTHTSEAYADADENDPNQRFLKGVVSVGENICRELNSRGIPTVHCTVIHDMGSNLNSYENAAETLADMLEVYPSIKYIIDVHRLTEYDDSGDALRTVSSTVDRAAQIKVSSGSVGQSPIDNLTLALCIRRELNSGGKRLCMPVELTGSKFNSDMSHYYLKVDIGGAGNTYAEAAAAGKYFAVALSEILKN